MLKVEKKLNFLNSNAVIIQGDITTGFSAALSSFFLKIPVFYVEAGLKTHNNYYPYPEEFNSAVINNISSLYFAPIEWGSSNLLKEDKNASNLFVTGNTIDSLKLTLKNTVLPEKIKTIIAKSKPLCKQIIDIK